MKKRNKHIIPHINLKLVHLLHLSDTHGKHEELQLDLEGIDIIAHTGDATNTWKPSANLLEWEKFIKWYGELPVKHKLFVPGNHDAACYHFKKFVKDSCLAAGVTYLEKELVEIEGIKFYGDPTTPTFNNWYFMSDRSKIRKHWDMIPQETQVLLTHGPRKGILDSADSGLVGDRSLGARIDELPDLILHCFGHIHDNDDFKNNGILVRDGICYSNASSVEDGMWNEKIKHHGNYLTI